MVMFDTKINIESSSDNLYSWVAGLLLLDDHHVVAVDSDIKSIKLLDTRSTRKSVQQTLKLKSCPWDATRITHNQLAVTLPDRGTIQFVSMSNIRAVLFTSWSMSLDKQIEVGGECCGLESYDDKLIVSCVRPAQVQILDMSGTVLQTINQDSVGQPLFRCPRYITLSADHSVLYVSDCDTHTVTSVTLGDGSVKFKYRDDGLRNPRGVTVGNDGMLYICCVGNDTIHMVTSEGRNVKVIPTGRDGLRYPKSIVYRHHDNTLYVGGEVNNVFVYKIKP